MNEVQSLQIVLGGMSQKLDSLEKKINEITESQQTGGETVQKSANSSNIIIKFLAVCIMYYLSLNGWRDMGFRL